MSELLENIVCIVWLVLAIMTFVELRKWNKKFSELYDELKRQIEEEWQ